MSSSKARLAEEKAKDIYKDTRLAKTATRAVMIEGESVKEGPI